MDVAVLSWFLVPILFEGLHEYGGGIQLDVNFLNLPCNVTHCAHQPSLQPMYATDEILARHMYRPQQELDEDRFITPHVPI